MNPALCKALNCCAIAVDEGVSGSPAAAMTAWMEAAMAADRAFGPGTEAAYALAAIVRVCAPSYGGEPGRAELYRALDASPGAAGPLAWQDFAECQYTDPEVFFPEKGGSARAAKQICRSCEVRAECLEYALVNGERSGIWGGLSERERRRVKRIVTAVTSRAPRLCRKRLHVMDEDNRTAGGRCRACREESGRVREAARPERRRTFPQADRRGALCPV